MKMRRWLGYAATFGINMMLATSVLAQGNPPSASQQAQRDRMGTCNAEAKTKGVTGDARKQFMSERLSKKPDDKPVTAQQTKMKTCNADATAKQLKADARKEFMSSCLKG
jgi:hypothetical protein